MPELKGTKRVAIIHDWLTGMRGGEKVLEVLCGLFPDADVFTLVHIPGNVSKAIEKHRIFTSPLQRFPNIGAIYRHLLPLMPWAIEQFDFTGYDLLISTSHCVAKAAIPSNNAIHVSYCHTPMRYIWDQYDSYFAPGRAGWPVRAAMSYFRPRLQRWDVSTTSRVHHFLANSKNVRERIQRLYHRDSQVIYPPANTEFYGTKDTRTPTDPEPFYLIVSALAPYKRLDIAIRAFTRLEKKLIVVGEGQDKGALRAVGGPSVEFRGWLSNEELRFYYQQAKALIFPGEEDFGIVPVEAMAAGCPVIAYGKGGALETVLNRRTGLFFSEQTEESLIQAVQQAETQDFDPTLISHHAQQFSLSKCTEAFRQFFATLPPAQNRVVR